jgi:hypothetical protein
VNDLPPPYGSTSLTVDSEVTASTNTLQDKPKSGMFDFFRRRDKSLTRAPTAIQRQKCDPDRRLDLGPSFSLPVQNEKEQLRCYLLEILAFTLGADYDSLNSALNDQTPAIAESTTSILSSSERKDLLRLSQAVNTLLQKIPQNTLTTVPQATKESVYTSVIVPASCLDTCCESYLLELISTYAYHQSNPSR